MRAKPDAGDLQGLHNPPALDLVSLSSIIIRASLTREFKECYDC
jgi:hypothetical protein